MVDTTRTVSGIAALLGTWLFASAYLFETSDPLFWTNVTGGALVVVFGGFNVYWERHVESNRSWRSVLAAVVGVWMVATPLVIVEAPLVATANSVLVGTLVAAMCGWRAYRARKPTGTVPNVSTA